LTAGTNVTITLDEGMYVSVSSVPNTIGTVTRTFINDGNTSQAIVDKIGPPAMSSVYGPYGRRATLDIECESGTVTYTTTGNHIVRSTTNPNTGGLRFPISGNTVSMLKSPRKAALLGDSIVAQNLEVSGGGSYYRGKGYLSWALARLGWPWDLQWSDQYAVGGTTIEVMLADQLPLLKSGHALYDYDRCFISCGTNDSNGGATISKMIEDASRLIGEIGALGITPVHIGILPRGTAGGMTDAKRKNVRFNDWLANYAAKTGNLEFIQSACESVANNADANGYILASMSADALHPNDLGGFCIGEAMYQYYAGMGLPSALQFAQSQADQYDATYNTSGVVFASPNPIMLGGTTAPTGMSSAGTNYTWAVGTRTLFNGQTKPVVGCTIAGATTNGYLYDDISAAGGWDTEAIQEGDQVYAQAIVEITTAGAGILPFLTIAESDGVSSSESGCLKKSTADVGTLPTGTILTLRTPNHTVKPYAGSGNASLFAKLNITSPAAAGAISVRAFEMRKVVP
jgi:hypothetical protein